MYKVICFDFDDVIIDTNLILRLGERFGNRLKELKYVIDFLLPAKNPRTFSADFHKAAKMARGMPFEKLKILADHMRLTHGVRGTLKKLYDDGYKLSIISANDRNLINYILDKNKINFFDSIFASHLETHNGILTGKLSGKVIKSEKKSVLNDVKNLYNVQNREIMFVADGLTDIPLFKLLGHGIFFCPNIITKTIIYRDPVLTKLEREKKIFIVEDKDLQEILPFIDSKYEKKHNIRKWYRNFWKLKFRRSK